jgi:hypothetical protein
MLQQRMGGKLIITILIKESQSLSLDQMVPTNQHQA